MSDLKNRDGYIWRTDLSDDEMEKQEAEYQLWSKLLEKKRRENMEMMRKRFNHWLFTGEHLP